MGVTIAVWRSRIGTFAGGHGSSSPGHLAERTSVPSGRASGVSNLLPLLLIGILLVIGNVEVNPGPTFPCGKCQKLFPSLGANALHQKNVHSNDSNFLFKCAMTDCLWQFHTFNALDIHISRVHKSQRHEGEGAALSTQCNVVVCDYSCSTNKELSLHLVNEHIEKGTAVKCPLASECKSDHEFSTSNRFWSHMSTKHKGWTKLVSAVQPSSTDDFPLFEGATDDNMDWDDVEDIQADEPLHTENVPEGTGIEVLRMQRDFYSSLSKFYMKLERENHVPVSTIDYITGELKRLTDMHLAIMKKAVAEALGNLNVTDEDKRRVVTDILSSDCMYEAHHETCYGPTFTTDSRRKTFYRNNFFYVESKAKNLSKDPLETKKTVYFVPIAETLSLLLQSAEISKEVEESFTRQSQPGLFEDYKDGDLYQNSADTHQKTIDILLFQDAFNPLKDLSSASKKNQVLGMYWTIGNLKSFLRSKLRCIQLAQLAPNFSAMYEEFGQKCFKPTFRQLKKLERTWIVFNGERLRVQLQYVIGDNKGQHEIGGFNLNFTGNCYCRFCELTKDEIHANPGIVGPLRTPASYEEASASVDDDSSNCLGVRSKKFNCIFNNLPDFHACDPRLAPCIAHDIFEGVITYDFSDIIHHFVQKGWFTYAVFNKRIAQFEYGHQDSRNKPAPVKWTKKEPNKRGKIGGHAVQNWTLLRLFPLIVDDLIKDKNDPSWKLYLELKVLVEFITAPALTVSQLDKLQTLSNQYAVNRQSLLGNGKPKHHFMYHYAWLFRLLGPLVHLFTLRFENFHQYFKRTARAANNTINLGITLVNKYQLYLSYLATGAPFCRGTVLLEEGIASDVWLKTTVGEPMGTVFEGFNIPSSATVVNKIRVDDINHKVKEWLLLGTVGDSEILVGIVLDDSKVNFLLKQYRTNYLEDVGLYEVMHETESLLYVPIENLKYPNAISLYEWDDGDAFSLKHILTHPAPTN